MERGRAGAVQTRRYSQANSTGVMRTVTIRLSGEDFPTAIVAMRDWLDKNRCEPTSYRYDQNEDTVVMLVDFADHSQAKAFAKRFRLHVRLSTGRPVSQYAGNEGCAGLAGADPHA